jgi:tetratricopeptide (TPR) repeat protein
MSEQDDIGPAQALVEQGLEHHHAGELVHADAHNLLGLARLQVGDTEGAVASIDRAVALRPEIAQYHISLGKARQGNADLEGAVAAFEVALRLDPELVEAHNDLGNALLARGDAQRAIACFEAALEVDPDYHLAGANLANTLHGQGRFREAERCYHRLLEQEPGNVAWLGALALVLGESERYAEAIEQCERARLLTPEDPVLAQRLLYFAAIDGSWVEHRAALTRLDAEQRAELAEVLEGRGLVGEAQACRGPVAGL